MRYLLIIVLAFSFSNLLSQNELIDTWVKIKVERKDGSKIVDHSNIEKAYLEYSFSKNYVKIINNPELISKQEYYIKDNELKIGNFINYIIENLSDTILILLDKPYPNLPDDKFNRYYFIKKKYYFDYLFENNKLSFENDTILIASNLLFPIYNDGSFSKLVNDRISTFKKGIVTGSFIITPKGNVENVIIYDRDKYNEKIDKKFEKAITASSGKWDLPQTKKEYYYKIDFTTRITGEFLLYISFFSLDRNKYINTGLTLDEISSASSHFNKGVKYITNEKFENAVGEFTKCIEIDSIYIDAYYNRAYSNYQIKKYTEACKDWKYLKELGQKIAESLFLENCE